MANLFNQPIDGVFDVHLAVNSVVPRTNPLVSLPDIRFMRFDSQEAIT